MIAVVAGDWLLWRAKAGLSAGLFVGVLTVLILVNRPRDHWNLWRCFQLLLLGLTAAQTAIRPSFSNFLVSCLLLVVVAGDSALPVLRPAWARWVRAAVSVIVFPATWFAFLRSCRNCIGPWQESYGKRLLGVGAMIAPACVLLVVYMAILGAGNAMLARVLNYGYENIIVWLSSMRLPAFTRLFLWVTLATVALVLLTPRVGGWTGARAKQEISTFPVNNPRRAVISSVLAFAAVNVLFFVSNTLDVIYLWERQALPAGVTYADYVHKGVWSLIAAVVLSACVMTVAFQQDGSVTRSRWMKGLALLWIGQNLMLLAGVLMRLMLYVNAYWLTPRRVYVSIFLILVVVGYLLLARHVFVRRSLKQLLLGNALAVFCLFNVVQFVNIPRLVADYNYQQWLAEPDRNIMQANLGCVLRDEMIPLVVRVAGSGLEVQAVSDARNELQFGDKYRDYNNWSLASDWRAWALRRAQLGSTLERYYNSIWD